MSECYVAANMRTSFTDLAGETNSHSSNSQSTTGGGGGGGQSSAQSMSNEYHHHHQQQQQHQKLGQQQFSSSLQLQNLSHRSINASTSNHHNNLLHTPHHGTGGPNQTTIASNHHLGNSSNINNNQLQQRSNHFQPTSNQVGVQNINNHHHHHNNHNHSYSATNSIPHHRLSQPTRTQIPIHCLIEQLDACADLPRYHPTITDNELFSTSDKPLPNHNQHNHSNQQLGQSSHLHQSKLALESVTNCNGISSEGSTRNESGIDTSLANDNVNDSDNNNDDIDNCNTSANITTSSNSLFHDNVVNNNAGDDDLDTNLDHLNPESPNSIHHQLPPLQDSCGISESFNNQAATSSYDSHHFQACRETYAIVTSNVLYIDLLRTVLLQLGYSAMDLINAKGKQFLNFMRVCCTVSDTLRNPWLARIEPGMIRR